MILVENLGFNSFLCGEQPKIESDDGFQKLCSESVRFSHAYTPSLMSQASIGSILSGLYPHQHGLRHNGNQYLSARVETLPEVANRMGARTAFFSGGAPIFRKSGLNQGFEIFEDQFLITPDRLFRPVNESVKQILNWYDNEVGRSPFFATLFVSDLQFPEMATLNNMGETREQSYAGQLGEVSESLARLIDGMKQRKIWDSTFVILAGLNSFQSPQRLEEMPFSNLNSESTRVKLIIKPARKGRESSFSWQVDANVSLVDIGQTLFEYFGNSAKPSSGRPTRPFAESVLKGQSLLSVLDRAQPEWPLRRVIMSETAWPAWQGLSGIRMAFRSEQYLWLHDRQPLFFNTLTDPLEVSPMTWEDFHDSEIRSLLLQAQAETQSEPWSGLSTSPILRWQMAKRLWGRPLQADELILNSQLQRQIRKEEWLASWLASSFLKKSQWNYLLELVNILTPLKTGTVLADREFMEDWRRVAQRKFKSGDGIWQNTCLRALETPGLAPESLKACPEPAFVQLKIWMDDSVDREAKAQAVDSLNRFVHFSNIAQTIAQKNQLLGGSWDIPMSLPAGPSAFDLALANPDYRKWQSSAVRSKARESD